jgi:hypothetical protein
LFIHINHNNTMQLFHDINTCVDFQCITCLAIPSHYEMLMKVEYLKVQTGILGNGIIPPYFKLVYDFCDKGIIIYMVYNVTDTMHGLHVIFNPNTIPYKVTLYDYGQPKWSITYC